MKRALVIGFGSIGKRHAKILSEMGFQVAVVSRRQIVFASTYNTCKDAVADWQPDYVVVASRTEQHIDDLKRLDQAGFKGRVLVEKPLLAKPASLLGLQFERLFVGYNLRFHPVMEVLRKALKDQKVLALMVHVGQFLGDWRPGTRYQESYSAERAGGGVLRDLSHELDYVLWLVGKWTRVTALGGKVSHLQIESDDLVSVLMETEKCPAITIHMNYLQKFPHRNIVAVTQDETIKADFIAGTVTIDDQVQVVKTDVNQSYRRQHEALSKENFDDLCTAGQGQAVVELIGAIERSISEKRWIDATAGL